MKRILFAVLATLTLTSSTYAAEISCVKPFGERAFEKYEGGARDFYPSGRKPIPNVTCPNGLVNGPIVKGDYEKVAAFIRANHPFESTFRLVSPGGDVHEALKIGRLFRRYLIATVAPTDRYLEYANREPRTTYGVPHLDSWPGSGSGDLCRGENCICASACALIWFGGIS